MLLVDAVFVVFLVAQATVIFGGHDYLERTTGLTYAEYVHQGFGQLTVATALTLLVVWAAARKAPRATSADLTWMRGSLGLLCALTLVVVASALYRMHVYQEAYGFTQLRLLVDVFEGWLGCWCSASWPRRHAAGRLAAPARAPSGAGALLGLAALNPDAWVAGGTSTATPRRQIDWAYLRPLRRRPSRLRRAAPAAGRVRAAPDRRRSATTGSSGTSAARGSTRSSTRRGACGSTGPIARDRPGRSEGPERTGTVTVRRSKLRRLRHPSGGARPARA